MTTSADTPEHGDSAAPPPHYRHFARECALQLLYQLDLNQDWELDQGMLKRFWQQAFKQDNAPSDEATLLAAGQYAERLVQGVAEQRAQLDQQLTAIARNWTLSRMTIIDRNILRIAAYEIQYVAEVPPLVSVDEAVELAKQFGDKNSSRFVNGIVDQMLPEHRTASDS